MSSDARARTDTRECNRLFAFGMGKQYGGSLTVTRSIKLGLPGAAPPVVVDDDFRGHVVSLERPGANEFLFVRERVSRETRETGTRAFKVERVRKG